MARTRERWHRRSCHVGRCNGSVAQCPSLLFGLGRALSRRANSAQGFTEQSLRRRVAQFVVGAELGEDDPDVPLAKAQVAQTCEDLGLRVDEPRREDGCSRRRHQRTGKNRVDAPVPAVPIEPNPHVRRHCRGGHEASQAHRAELPSDLGAVPRPPGLGRAGSMFLSSTGNRKRLRQAGYVPSGLWSITCRRPSHPASTPGDPFSSTFEPSSFQSSNAWRGPPGQRSSRQLALESEIDGRGMHENLRHSAESERLQRSGFQALIDPSLHEGHFLYAQTPRVARIAVAIWRHSAAIDAIN
jgi:hypothetical protein